MNIWPPEEHGPEYHDALKTVEEKTTEVFKIGHSWGFKVTDPGNRKRRLRLESRLHAEWRLTETRLCLFASILNVDIMDALYEIQDGEQASLIDPFHAPKPYHWTYYIPDPLIFSLPEDHIPFEAYDCMRIDSSNRRFDLAVNNKAYSAARDHIECKLRHLAISKAEERVADLHQNPDGKWCYEHMLRNGQVVTCRHGNKLSAHNHRAVDCLRIAADILRLDIRKQMEDYQMLLMKSDHWPDQAPDLGEWWRWLPMRHEVPRLPGDRNYFDVSFW